MERLQLVTTWSYPAPLIPSSVYRVVNNHKNDISATVHFLSTEHTSRLKHNAPRNEQYSASDASLKFYYGAFMEHYTGYLP